MLRVCHTISTQKGSVAGLLSGWGRLLDPKDTGTRYRIRSRTKVSQPFDC